MNATITCRDQDHLATRLRCAGCGTPICPTCLHRTPVGLKCETCARPTDADAAVARRLDHSRRAHGVAIALTAAAALAALLLALDRLAGSPGTATSPDTPDAATRTTPSVVVATTPEWELRARTEPDGVVCATMDVRAWRASEACERTGVPWRTGFGTLRGSALPSGYVVWTLVAPDVDQVVVARPDGTTETVAPVGSGPARFAFAAAPRGTDVTLTALNRSGEEIGRRTMTPPPGR